MLLLCKKRKITVVYTQIMFLQMYLHVNMYFLKVHTLHRYLALYKHKGTSHVWKSCMIFFFYTWKPKKFIYLPLSIRVGLISSFSRDQLGSSTSENIMSKDSKNTFGSSVSAIETCCKPHKVAASIGIYSIEAINFLTSKLVEMNFLLYKMMFLNPILKKLSF